MTARDAARYFNCHFFEICLPIKNTDEYECFSSKRNEITEDMWDKEVAECFLDHDRECEPIVCIVVKEYSKKTKFPICPYCGEEIDRDDCIDTYSEGESEYEVFLGCCPKCDREFKWLEEYKYGGYSDLEPV